MNLSPEGEGLLVGTAACLWCHDTGLIEGLVHPCTIQSFRDSCSRTPRDGRDDMTARRFETLAKMETGSEPKN